VDSCARYTVTFSDQNSTTRLVRRVITEWPRQASQSRG
jgi:hypothetical protein